MPKKRYAQKISSKIKICSKFTNVRAGKKNRINLIDSI